jgi:mycothiol synthase
VTLEIREPTIDESPAIRGLIDEHAQAAFGETEVSEEEIRTWFERPKLSIRVGERDGQLLGYLDIYADDSGNFPADIRTLDAEVASGLVAEAEAIAGDQGAESVRAFVQGDDPVMREVLEAGGWEPIRYSFQMRIDLDGDIPEPVWPDGLTPRNPRADEYERIYEANQEAFADHWDFHRVSIEEWRTFAVESHGYDPGRWWVVDDGDEVAAYTINSWHFSGDPQFGWVGSLGVRRPWRRRGLATALLRHSFRDFREQGATRVGLGVDGENTTGAVRLYESVGMHVARRNDTYERTL